MKIRKLTITLKNTERYLIDVEDKEADKKQFALHVLGLVAGEMFCFEDALTGYWFIFKNELIVSIVISSQEDHNEQN